MWLMENDQFSTVAKAIFKPGQQNVMDYVAQVCDK